ncbi:MFS transporter [Streptomyces sp. L7]
MAGVLANDANWVIAARTVMRGGRGPDHPARPVRAAASLFGPDGTRTKAVGIISAASSLGLLLGSIIGGFGAFWPLLVGLRSTWSTSRWPRFGIAACVFLLPETSDPASPEGRRPLHRVSTAAGLGALIYAIIEAPRPRLGRPAGRGHALSVPRSSSPPWCCARTAWMERPMLGHGDLLAHRGFLFGTHGKRDFLDDVRTVRPAVRAAAVPPVRSSATTRSAPARPPAAHDGRLDHRGPRRAAARRPGSAPVRSHVTAGLVVLACCRGARQPYDAGRLRHACLTALLWLSVTGFGFGFIDRPRDGRRPRRAALVTGPAAAPAPDDLLRQVGAAIGIALLGSLLREQPSAGRPRRDRYLPRRRRTRPGSRWCAAQHRRPEDWARRDLIASANSACVHGMGLVLLVCGAAALVTALLAAAFLPNTPAAPAAKEEEDPATAVAVALADAGQ